MSFLDMQVVRVIMMFSLSTAIVIIIIKLFWFHHLERAQRIRQLQMAVPNIIWLSCVITFYTYAILVMPYYKLISEVWFYAWGASLVLHGVINALGVLLSKIMTIAKDVPHGQ